MLQLSQSGQPGAEGQFHLALMKRQMVVQLRQVNPWADRVQQPPDLLQPIQAALPTDHIPCRPDRCDPGFPDSVAVNE